VVVLLHKHFIPGLALSIILSALSQIAHMLLQANITLQHM